MHSNHVLLQTLRYSCAAAIIFEHLGGVNRSRHKETQALCKMFFSAVRVPRLQKVGCRAHPIPLYGVQHLVRELVHRVSIGVAAMHIIKAAQQTHGSKTGVCKAMHVLVCCCCLYSIACQANHGAIWMHIATGSRQVIGMG